MKQKTLMLALATMVAFSSITTHAGPFGFLGRYIRGALWGQAAMTKKRTSITEKIGRGTIIATGAYLACITSPVTYAAFKVLSDKNTQKEIRAAFLEKGPYNVKSLVLGDPIITRFKTCSDEWYTKFPECREKNPFTLAKLLAQKADEGIRARFGLVNPVDNKPCETDNNDQSKE